MIPFIIYACVPLLGVANCMRIVRRLRVDPGPPPPILAIVVLHVLYGGLLVVLLTDRFWRWSGMASVGMAVLLLVGCPWAVVQAWRLMRGAGASRYHRIAAVLSWLYPVAVGALALWAARISVH